MDVLGFKIKLSSGMDDGADWVLLQLNDIEFMLNTGYEKQNRPALPNVDRIAAHGDTTFYFGCRETDALYAHLVTKGIEVKKPYITGYGWKALAINDPDGYKLCFHWRVDEQ